MESQQKVKQRRTHNAESNDASAESSSSEELEYESDENTDYDIREDFMQLDTI